MWSDELMVAVTADYPVAYIAQWARTLEVHPPYFHYFIKLVEYVGHSDLILRLPSALAGTATVWLVYRLGRRIVSTETALIVSTLFAFNPLHVWISRQLRPYAILVLLSLFAFYYLYRFLKSGDSRHLVRLFLVNWGIILLHFISILIVGAEIVLVFCWYASHRVGAPWRRIAVFLAATTLSFVPVLPFLVSMFTIRNDMSAPAPFDVCFHNTVSYLGGVLNLFFPGWVTQIMAALAILGLAGFAFFNIRIFFLCLFLVVLPVAAILAKRYNTFFYSSHISFMLTPLLFPVAAGLGALAGRPAIRRAAALLLCLGFGATLFVRDYSKLYNEDSNIITWYDFGPLKTTARDLAAVLKPGDAVIVHDPMALSYFNWYLDQIPPENLLENQRLRPTDKRARVFLLGLDEGFGHLAKDGEGMRKIEAYAGSRKIARYYLHELDFDRTPVQIVKSLPFAASLSAKPSDLYARAWSMEGLTVHPYWNCTLFPTANEQDGLLEYVFRNETGLSRQSFNLSALYENVVENGVLEMTSQFDDEEETRVFSSQGPDKNRYSGLSLERTRPWTTLRVRVRLFCPLTTPRYPGGNLTGVSLESVSASICSLDDPGPCSDIEYRNLVSMIQRSYLDQAFLAKSAYPSQKADFGAAGLKRESSGYPRWDVLSPGDVVSASFVVDMENIASDAVFYPRVSGLDGAVTVYALDESGGRRELMSLKGLPEVWTPISAQYPVNLSSLAGKGKVRLLVELKGRFAQVWTKNGSVFF